MTDLNFKYNEYLHRRVHLDDVIVISAHLCAHQKSISIPPSQCHGVYIISSVSPFCKDEIQQIRENPDLLVSIKFPEFRELYDKRGWTMCPTIDRVYESELALNWTSLFSFQKMLSDLIQVEMAGTFS